MKNRIVILAAADRDLDEQAEYLAENAGLDTALRFYEAARTTFAFLAQSPGVGALRETDKPALAGILVGRIKGFVNHLVFYLPTEDGVEVVRIIHGHRDIDSVFDNEDDS